MNIYDIYIDGVGIVASSVLGYSLALRERRYQLLEYQRRNSCLRDCSTDLVRGGHILDTPAVSQCCGCTRYCCAYIRKVGVYSARVRRSCHV